MKENAHLVWYFEEFHGGHGGNTSPADRAKISAMEFAFLFETLVKGNPGLGDFKGK